MRTDSAFRERPALTQFAFSRLLEWLDEGVDSNGERYLEMRRRLVAYFDRKNRPDPDMLADETLNRVGRTLEEQGVILTKPAAKYCYVVARFVLLEDFRKKGTHVRLRDSAAVPAWRGRSPMTGLWDDESALRERRLTWLDHCLQELRVDQRELVVDYYRDAQREKIDRRRNLARRLGITMNALGIRVCRIRDALTACMERRGAAHREGFGPVSSYHRGDPSSSQPLPFIRK